MSLSAGCLSPAKCDEPWMNGERKAIGEGWQRRKRKATRCRGSIWDCMELRRERKADENEESEGSEESEENEENKE